MTALASSDISITLTSRDRNVYPTGSKLLTLATIAFGDGSLTYPAGGIPMPVIGMFGFKKELQFCSIQQPSANGFIYKYDKTNHKLKIFTQGLVMGSTAASTYDNGALAEDSGAAETAVRISGGVADTTYDLGGMIEMLAATTPAAVSIVLLMMGE